VSNGTDTLKSIFGKAIFDYSKSPELILKFLKMANVDETDTILDFFSGSATTAHAVMKINAEDGGNRRFIMVQLPEVTDEKSEARKAGYNTICEIGKERIRRAGKLIKQKLATDVDVNKSLSEARIISVNGYKTSTDLFDQVDRDDLELKNHEIENIQDSLDIGFRVLKLAESNMEDVFYTPDKFDANNLFTLADNVKQDRTAEDLLFQVMLELGVELSSSIEKKSINGVEVFNVKDGFLVATFDKDVNESTITEIAKNKPVYFVMRDASAASDNVLDNFDQLFRHYSPDTIRKIL
jgi:adenine-specific DNA-methyltransferase